MSSIYDEHQSLRSIMTVVQLDNRTNNEFTVFSSDGVG